MKSLLLFVCLCVAVAVASSLALAQPDSLWSRTYGDGGPNHFATVLQTEDGGYVLADNTNHPGQGFNAWIVRTNAQGDTLWCRDLGGWGWEGILDIGRASDGGYYGIGSTMSYGSGGGDAWLVKLDDGGSVSWTRTYGGSLDDWAYMGQQTTDGGYILAATTNSFGHPGVQDFWLIKTNANGDSVWSRTYGGLSLDGGYSVVQTTEGGYMFVGMTCSFGDTDGDFWLIKTDANGNALWSRTYGGPGADFPYRVRQTLDGGYVVTGNRTRSDGLTDAWLLKTDANGESEWSALYGVPFDSKVGMSIIQTNDSGYAVAGGRQWNSGSGLGDGWIFRTDREGNFLWQRTFGGSLEDAVWDFSQTADGGYALAGYTASFGSGSTDGWLIKTGPDVRTIEGGETCLTAKSIPGIPFKGAGNTGDNLDNYNLPFAAPTGGKDVVYRYIPATNQCVDIALCNASFDTRLSVYQGECGGIPYRYNEDACSGPNFPFPWLSRLAGVELLAGQTYYIVVDAYDQYSYGGYSLEITTCGPPWVPDQPCPVTSLFGQPPYNESIGWGSTDVPGPTWQRIYDNISGVTEPICAVEFWGFSGDYVGSNFVPCDVDPRTFTITFCPDSAGYPGGPVASYTLALSREPAGNYSWPIWKYTAVLDPCVTLQDGWMSVQGANTGLPNCYFIWSSSPTGDGMEWARSTSAWNRIYTDHAFCLMPESVNPPVIWTQVASAPTAFGSAGSDVLGNYYYHFGGSMTRPIAQAFNLITEQWEASTPPPIGWNRFGAAATGNAIYLIGWCTVFPTMGNAVQKFSPTSGGPIGTWNQLSPYPITALGMAVAWDGGNYIYCAGGSDNVNVFANAYRYDIAADSWSPLTSMPFGTVWSGGAFIGGKFYALGGIYSPQSLLEYDPIANTWLQKAAPPSPVYYGISTTDTDSLLFSIGGGGVSYPQSNAVQVYSPWTDTWSQETSLPVVIGGNSAHFVPPDKVISAGGYMNGQYQALTYRGTGFPAVSVAPPDPQALVIYIANGVAHLQWQPSLGATMYHIYGSLTPGGAAELLATVTSTTWVDAGFASRPSVFFYTVTAE